MISGSHRIAAPVARTVARHFSPRSFNLSRPATPPPLNPRFALMCEGYHVRLADQAPALRTQIGELVQRMYDARGLNKGSTWRSARPHRPWQGTFAACREERVFGTLTLGVDTGAGLLADELYREQIDAFRARGRRVCEVTRLALERREGPGDALARIINMAFLVARHAWSMTDAFIEVHPRHVGYYKRMLGYTVAGPQRTCPRVGAPAVLMHLCLVSAERRVAALHQNDVHGERSLYRHFLPPAEAKSLVNQILTPEPVALAS